MGDPVPRCPRCGGANSPGSAFCIGCGRALPGDTVRLDRIPTASVGDDHGALPPFPPAHGRTLLVQNGPMKGSRLEITRPQATIGRDPNCDVFLDDVAVSRRHATLRAAVRSDTIADSGSLNGTYVNGARVESSSLASGDVIQVGRCRLLYLAASARGARTAGRLQT